MESVAETKGPILDNTFRHGEAEVPGGNPQTPGACPNSPTEEASGLSPVECRFKSYLGHQPENSGRPRDRAGLGICAPQSAPLFMRKEQGGKWRIERGLICYLSRVIFLRCGLKGRTSVEHNSFGYRIVRFLRSSKRTFLSTPTENEMYG